MARIAIVGVGAIGGAVAGLLEMAGALGDSLGEEILAYYRGAPPDAVNSLFADRLAGRCMETDARNGAIVRKGVKHGIPTPLNSMAVTLLDAQQPGRVKGNPSP
ncbi:MAG: ketopantoate reductase C-terminal domain-containing protein [Steroidobacteraceae bacterium]